MHQLGLVVPAAHPHPPKSPRTTTGQPRQASPPRATHDAKQCNAPSVLRRTRTARRAGRARRQGGWDDRLAWHATCACDAGRPLRLLCLLLLLLLKLRIQPRVVPLCSERRGPPLGNELVGANPKSVCPRWRGQHTCD